MLSFQIKYPTNTLHGKTIRRALITHLHAPVLASGDLVFPFRVVWRVVDQQRAEAWDHIVSQRRLCDELVAQTRSLQMFVSCISGVFKKAVSAQSEAGPVFPAVCYWAVFKDVPVDFCGQVMSRILPICPAVQVKPITSLGSCQALSLHESTCKALFVVLKDHNGGFISRKIDRSLQVAGIASHGTNAKLIAMPDTKYLPQLPACVKALSLAGLDLEVHVLQGSPAVDLT